MDIYMLTLGCKVNQFETQALETVLAGRGHRVLPSPEGCDAFIVNTCAVTAESGRKSRQAIRRLRRLCPGAICAVCGCYAQAEGEKLEELGVDLLGGSGGRMAFAEELEKLFAVRRAARVTDDPMKRRTFERLPAGNLGERTRALLKIQDGCDNYCSYCIIPHLRGPVRSLPKQEAAAEAERLAREGYRELVVTGIEIASYGRDLRDGSSLADAVCAIAAAAPTARIRLGSLEPRAVTPDFARALAQAGRICPHFHLSLQSGSDAVLRRMRRRYTTERFFESVCTLREFFPGCALTADLITGFPGETEEEFEETLAFIRRCRFSSMHVFPYSRRPGTPADAMPGQVPNAVKRERAARAGAAAREMQRDYLLRQVGRTLSVLFETCAGGASRGHAENYCETQVFGKIPKNTVGNVQITGENGGVLLGEMVLSGDG